MATYQRPRMVYPIHDVDDYKGRIIFRAVRENYETLGGAISTVAQRSLRQIQDQENVPQDQNDAIHNAQIAAAQAQSSSIKTVKARTPGKTPIGSVQLYLPNQLQFGDAAEFTQVDLGIVGGAVALGLRNNESGGAVAKRLLQSSLPTFDSLYDAAINGLQSEAAQVAALRIAGNLGSGVSGAVETETGVTLNPNRRSTFKGIGLRRFNFNFQLIPTSAEEAREIKKIVAFLREQLYPETAGNIGNLPGVSAAFKFPSKFEIKLLYGNKRVGTGILPCFLERINVTYNPNAMAFHSDGNPQETQISLSFIEERALTKQDVINDNRAEGISFS